MSSPVPSISTCMHDPEQHQAIVYLLRILQTTWGGFIQAARASDVSVSGIHTSIQAGTRAYLSTCVRTPVSIVLSVYLHNGVCATHLSIWDLRILLKKHASETLGIPNGRVSQLRSSPIEIRHTATYPAKYITSILGASSELWYSFPWPSGASQVDLERQVRPPTTPESESPPEFSHESGDLSGSHKKGFPHQIKIELLTNPLPFYLRGKEPTQVTKMALKRIDSAETETAELC